MPGYQYKKKLPPKNSFAMQSTDAESGKIYTTSVASQLTNYYKLKQNEIQHFNDKDQRRIDIKVINKIDTTQQAEHMKYESTYFQQLNDNALLKNNTAALNYIRTNIAFFDPTSNFFCSDRLEFPTGLVYEGLKDDFHDILYEFYEILVKNAYFDVFKICNDYEALVYQFIRFETPFKKNYLPSSYRHKFKVLIETLKKYSFEKNSFFRDSFNYALENYFNNNLHNKFIELYCWSNDLLDYKNVLYELFCKQIKEDFKKKFENEDLIKKIQRTPDFVEEILNDGFSYKLEYYTIRILQKAEQKRFVEKIKVFIKKQKLKQICQKSYELCMDDEIKQAHIFAELKQFFKQHEDYLKLFARNLQEAVNKRINIGSGNDITNLDNNQNFLFISTAELIFMYVKLLGAMKCLGSVANSIKHLMFPMIVEKIKERNDAANILCLSIFDKEITTLLYQSDALDSKFNIDIETIAKIKEECQIKLLTEDDPIKASFNSWFEKTHLNWKPEPIENGMKLNCIANNYQEFLNVVAKVNTYDKYTDQEKSTLYYMVMTLFPQNKEDLLVVFLTATKNLFLNPKFTSSEFWRWQAAMKIILHIVSNENLSAADNDSPITALLCNLQIMVNDFHLFSNSGNSDLLALSSNYWNIEASHDYFKLNELFKSGMYEDISLDIIQLIRKYTTDNIGQKINILYDKSYMDVNLKFADGREVKQKAPFLNALLVFFISENSITDELNISFVKQQAPFASLKDELIETALDYWVEYKVLSKNGPHTYKVIENLKSYMNSLSGSSASKDAWSSSGNSIPLKVSDNDDGILLKKYNINAELHLFLEPLIKGVITSQKRPLSIDNIHSWLNLSTPVNSTFKLTLTQLENYLQYLLESGILTLSSNSCYKIKQQKHIPALK